MVPFLAHLLKNMRDISNSLMKAKKVLPIRGVEICSYISIQSCCNVNVLAVFNLESQTVCQILIHYCMYFAPYMS